MHEYDHLRSCLDLSDKDLETASCSRVDARALFGHLARIAQPNQGAVKMLAVVARIATCPWIDGSVRVEIGGDADLCVIDVLSELVGGFKERLWPTVVVRVPLDELRRAVRLQPSFLLPLKVKHDRQRRLILAVRADERFSSLPPPHISVGDTSLTWGRRTDPPLEIKIPQPAQTVPFANAEEARDVEGLPAVNPHPAGSRVPERNHPSSKAGTIQTVQEKPALGSKPTTKPVQTDGAKRSAPTRKQKG